MGRRSDIDWEAIEADYRIGRLTVRAMEAKYGVRAETIVRHMKRLGITRDLSEQVRAATRAKVLAEAIDQSSTDAKVKIKSAVDAAAEEGARLIGGHKSTLGGLREVAAEMMQELRALGAARRAGLSDEAIMQIGAQIGLDPAEVRAVIEANSLPVRASVADRLAGVLAKLIPLERKSYGLDEEGGKATWESEWLKLVEEYDKARGGDDGSAARA